MPITLLVAFVGKAREEYEALPEKVKAKLSDLAHHLQELSTPNRRLPRVRHLEGDLWEIKADAQGVWGRAIFCRVRDGGICLLRCFRKKTNRTPRNEIAVAKQRMREIR